MKHCQQSLYPSALAFWTVVTVLRFLKEVGMTKMGSLELLLFSWAEFGNGASELEYETENKSVELTVFQWMPEDFSGCVFSCVSSPRP